MKRCMLAFLLAIMGSLVQAQQVGGTMTLFQGYTGTDFTNGWSVRNQAAGTGTDMLNGRFNSAVVGVASPTGGTTGIGAGVYGVAANGRSNFGVLGRSTTFKIGSANVGGGFFGINTSAGSIQGPSVGVYAALDNFPATTAQLDAQLPTSVALIADSRATQADVLHARINGLVVLSVPGDGQLQLHTPMGYSRPACDAAHRGALWYEAGATGVADTFALCRKDAADVYAWGAP